MKNNHKTIQNLLLLITLSVCWHSSVSAMESMDVDVPKVDADKLEKKTTTKRTIDQAKFSEDTKASFKKPCTGKQASLVDMDVENKEVNAAFKQPASQASLAKSQKLILQEQNIKSGGFLPNGEFSASKYLFAEEETNLPDDVINCIIDFFGLSKGQKALLDLSATNKRVHNLIEHKYAKANELKNHHPWQVPLPLPTSLPSTLYIFNSRMGTILGLFVNIKMHKMAFDKDRDHFEWLCSSFIKNPFFLGNTLPVMYVELLQRHLSVLRPKPSQNSLAGDSLEEKRESCLLELSAIPDQQNFAYQNEGALYYHYHKFVVGALPENLPNLPNILPFETLDNSFMVAMNQELLNLKNTQGLSAAGDFASTWEKILALEPVITIEQRDRAAISYFNAGRKATDQGTKLANFIKAVKCFEEMLETIKDAKQTPAAVQYANTACAYYRTGKFITELSIKAANFTKAVEYYEKALDTIRVAGQTPSADYYINTADAHFSAGLYAIGQGTKFKNFTKAAEYFEKALNAIKIARQTPTADYYTNTAKAYFAAGLNATDQSTKLKHFTKAAGYGEKNLEAIKDAQQTPTAHHYSNTARANYEAGRSAADVNDKIKNFTIAKTHFETSLEMGLDEVRTQQVRSILKEINTYLSDNNKIAADKSVDERSRDG